MALLLAHDWLSPKANTVHYVHVLNSWAWPSLGRHLRPACNQGLLEILLNPKNMIFDLNTVCCYWLSVEPPVRGDWGAVWGSPTHKLTLSPRLRRVWGPHKKLVGCFLIGRNGSREHKRWRSNANQRRDPLKQYPYCLSRALIGYRLA